MASVSLHLVFIVEWNRLVPRQRLELGRFRSDPITLVPFERPVLSSKKAKKKTLAIAAKPQQAASSFLSEKAHKLPRRTKFSASSQKWERLLATSEIEANGNTLPSYPSEAEQRGWEGRVRLRLFIDKRGDVEKVEIVDSSGFSILDETGKSASQNWRFPHFVGDERGEIASFIVDINFKLD